MSLIKNSVCPFEKQEVFCKICDGTDGAMESIFCEQTNERLINKIYKCTNVKVKPVFGIISPICEFCRFRIDQFDDDFKPSCKEYVVEKIVSVAPDDDPFNCIDPMASAGSLDSSDNVIECLVEMNDPIEEPCVTEKVLPDVLNDVNLNEPEDEYINEDEEIDSDNSQEELLVELQTANNGQARESSDGKESKIQDTDSSFKKKKRKRGRPRLTHPGTLPSLKKPEKCKICGKMVSYMKDHLRNHSQSNRLKCPHCDRTFIQSNNLIYHIRKHTGEKPFQCDKCDKSFICKSHLLSHLRSHVNDQPYQCEFCSKRFNQACNLRKHLRVHSGEKPYKCSICSKAFMNLSNKKIHEKRHMGERNFTCEICSKSFYDNHHLERHITTHSKEKPHMCLVCSKSFSTATGLKTHEVKHSRPKVQHKCGICSKVLTSVKRLKAHVERHNTDILESKREEKVYQCTDCSKQFKRPGLLHKHNQRVHSSTSTHVGDTTMQEQLRSQVSKRAFANRAPNLRLSASDHIYTRLTLDCQQCGKEFDNSESLEEHISTTHESMVAVIEDDKTLVMSQTLSGTQTSAANTQLIELPSVVLPDMGQVVVKFELQHV